MFVKLLLVLVIMTASGAALLEMRAERLAAEHDIAQLHRRIDDHRRAVWDAQVRVADRAGPSSLRRTLARGDRAYEAIPVPEDAPASGRYAAAPPRR